MHLFACLRCGKDVITAFRIHTQYMCKPCRKKHAAEGVRAINAIGRAKSRGQIPKASTLECEDCGNPACDYDHRDYTKPLEVSPVCRGCNAMRGPAFDSVYRIPDQASQSAITPICSPSQT